MRAAVLALAISFGACGHNSPCPVYRPAAAPRPLIWRITSPSRPGSLVVLATHQATTSDDVPEVAWTEFSHASLYVAEAREPDSERDGDYNWSAVTHQTGASLRAKIGDFAFNRLSFYLDVSPDQLFGLRPWVALTLLGQDAYPVKGPSMTEALFARAMELAVPIEPLDSWEEQLVYLDAAITPATLRAAIENYDHLGCALRYRVAAFQAGDDRVFANERVDTPVKRRNLRWLVHLMRVLGRGEHAFAALGIGHLVGPEGILEGFADHGFRVERL